MASNYKKYTIDDIKHMSMVEYSQWRQSGFHLVDQDSYEFYRARYIQTGSSEYLKKMVERVEPYEE